MGLCMPAEDIKPWWIWFYWVNPLTYAQQGAPSTALPLLLLHCPH